MQVIYGKKAGDKYDGDYIAPKELKRIYKSLIWRTKNCFNLDGEPTYVPFTMSQEEWLETWKDVMYYYMPEITFSDDDAVAKRQALKKVRKKLGNDIKKRSNAGRAARTVRLDGVDYPSITEACVELGIKEATGRGRLVSEASKWKDWDYSD